MHTLTQAGAAPCRAGLRSAGPATAALATTPNHRLPLNIPDSAAPAAPNGTPAAAAAAVVNPLIANGWLHTAKFLTSAPQLHHLPPHAWPEIAFVGRSNAGKSTCINTLTQQKQLAFASKRPGRTQHINLFTLGKQGITDAVLADLPGYGYAAVPKQEKLRWQQVMANYLMTRENLRGIVMLCDPRLGLTELDEILLDVIRERIQGGLKLLVLLTKADKLTRSEAAKALSITRLQTAGGEVRLFSAPKRIGIDEAAQVLWGWTHEGVPAAAQAAATITTSHLPTAGENPHEPVIDAPTADHPHPPTGAAP